jgi:hypothetical protein
MEKTNNELIDALAREGVLITVNLSYWRGHKKLRPEEVGLEPSKISDRLVSLGHKRLLPRECFDKLSLIEGRVHAFIEANTFPFLGGLAHFLPNTKLEDVTTRLKELEAEFHQAKELFVACYLPWRETALAEWQNMINGLGLPNAGEVIGAIEAAYPAQHRLEKHFGFETRLFQVVSPLASTEAITLADQRGVIEARQRAASEAEAQLRQETEHFVSDCVVALRSQTAQLCTDMLQSINTGETGVHQKTLNRLVKFIDQFRQLNFVGDRAMEQQLDEVRQQLLTRTAEEYRSNSNWKQQLINGLTGLADRAKAMASEDTSALIRNFGELGKRKFSLAA